MSCLKYLVVATYNDSSELNGDSQTETDVSPALHPGNIDNNDQTLREDTRVNQASCVRTVDNEDNSSHEAL